MIRIVVIIQTIMDLTVFEDFEKPLIQFDLAVYSIDHLFSYLCDEHSDFFSFPSRFKGAGTDHQLGSCSLF